MRRFSAITVALAVLLACGADETDDQFSTTGLPPVTSASGEDDAGGETAGSEGPDDGWGTFETGSTDEADGGTSDGSGETPASCVGYCGIEMTCGLVGYASTQDCTDACSDAIDKRELSGPVCVSTYDNLLYCLSSLGCSELGAYYEAAGQPMETGYPCREQDVEVLIECGG